MIGNHLTECFATAPNGLGDESKERQNKKQAEKGPGWK
ncbi:hypothetical protein B0O95_106162 [Mycetohabitans endofungorum]|uniref:Uncharacterized protein n=1 Tax=Mycetohabitans endofungorum TaxID=417203 RepID=A0A2P5KAM7_9BURK|nr:hypothetical protein B0O95_106162 [Mycetohabitans endofungorum]